MTIDARRRRRRAGAAVAVSSVLHVGFLVLLLSVASRPYNLPRPEEVEPPAPAMTVEILQRPPPKPPIIPPKLAPSKIEAAPPTPPTAPPEPAPPAPAPTPPAPAITAPAKPAPTRPTPLPVTPAPATPAPRVPAVKSAPPAPTPAPTPVLAPAPKLNIHKPEKEAPASIATLPMSPAPSQPKPGSSGGAPAAGGPPGGSRLSGLTPYPAGAFPSGGTGLRGSLVGCANAEAVKLSGVERAHCNERFGVEITKAPALDGIPPAKRAQFDAEAAKDEATRRRMNAAVVRPTGLASPGIPGIGGGIQTGPNSSMAHSSEATGPHD